MDAQQDPKEFGREPSGDGFVERQHRDLASRHSARMREKRGRFIERAALAVLCFGLGAPATPAFSQDLSGVYRLIEKRVKRSAENWVRDRLVIEAIKDQNQKNREISRQKILDLDKQWRSERKQTEKPLINDTLANELSRYLLGVKKKGKGLYTEIFVMDNQGLNVVQSDVTTDYWQGDEAKWKETYLKGPEAIHLGEIEFDESTQKLQVQLSLSISENGETIGAITIGVDAVKGVVAGRN